MKLEPALRGALCGIGAFLCGTAALTSLHREPSPAIQLLQVAHLFVGRGFVVVGAAYLLVHLAQVFGGAGAALRRIPRGAWLTIVAMSAFLILTSRGLGGIRQRRLDLVSGWITVFILAAALFWVTRALRRIGGISKVATGVVLLYVWVIALMAGAVIPGGIEGRNAYRLHVRLSVLSAVALLGHVALSRTAPAAGRGAAREYQWRGPLLRAGLPAVVASCLASAACVASLVGKRDPPAAAGSATSAPESAENVIIEACAQCHATVVHTWRESGHALAASNPVFTALLTRLSAARGPGATRACLVCHAPGAPDPALASMEQVFGSDGYRDGVDCDSCHRSAPGPSGRDGDLSFIPITMRGFLFLPPRSGGASTPPRVFRYTDLSPGNAVVSSRIALHRDAFPHAVSSEVCSPCHVQTLAPHTGGRLDAVVQDQYASWASARDALQGKTCASCHMPRFIAEEAYTSADHRFRAAGTYIARLAGGSGGERDAVAALQGRAPLAYGESRAEGEGTASPLLSIEVSRQEDPAALVIESRNTGRIGHSFPNGPTDLVRVWLSLEVRDATGRTVVSVGKDGPEDAPTLGHTFLDEDGGRIDDHRLWAVAQVIDHGTIPVEGGHRLAIPLPSGDLQWPIAVRAAWNYRRFDPALVARLTGGEPLGIPVVTLAERSARVE